MIHLASPNSKSFLSQFDPNQVQPNAIDLRVDKLYAFDMDTTFELGELDDGTEHKKHIKIHECKPNKDGWWDLHMRCYQVVFEGNITVGEDEAGFVITRSTLNRTGLMVRSGLYDSGYSGVMAGFLDNMFGTAKIRRGARLGQFLLFKAESLLQYDGDYGTGKAHDEKYGE